MRTVPALSPRHYAAGNRSRCTRTARVLHVVARTVCAPNNMGLASFLLRTGARDARQIQWGGRFVF